MELVSNSKSGFTLVEFMVAILILMIGILALLQMVNASISHGLSNQFRNEAVLLADETLTMEMAKGSREGFDLISTTTNTKIVPRQIMGTTLKNFNVVKVGTSVSTNTKEVDVTVSWIHKNVNYTQQAATLISKNP